jgi:hypothetical protein
MFDAITLGENYTSTHGVDNASRNIYYIREVVSREVHNGQQYRTHLLDPSCPRISILNALAINPTR